MAGTWLGSRSESFFLGKIFGFWPESPFFAIGPRISSMARLYIALAKAIDLAPSDPFFDFSFPSYGNFREADPPPQQKVLPHLTAEALTDSNSPSALSVGWIIYIFISLQHV